MKKKAIRLTESALNKTIKRVLKEELYNIPDNASVTSNFNGPSEPITTYTATNSKHAQEIMQNGFTLPQSNADATSLYGSGIYTVGDTRVLKSGVYGDTIIQCQLLNSGDYKKFNSPAEARKAIENGYNGDIAVITKSKGLMYITRNPNNVRPMRIINTKDNQNFMNESDIHRIVKESVNKVLTELDWRTYANAADKRREQGRNVYDLEQAASKDLSKRHGGRDLQTFGREGGERAVYDDKWSSGSNAKGPDIIGNYYTSSPEKDWRHNRPTIEDMRKWGDIPYDWEWEDEACFDDDDIVNRAQWKRVAREIDDYTHGRTKYLKGKGWQ